MIISTVAVDTTRGTGLCEMFQKKKKKKKKIGHALLTIGIIIAPSIGYTRYAEVNKSNLRNLRDNVYQDKKMCKNVPEFLIALNLLILSE